MNDSLRLAVEAHRWLPMYRIHLDSSARILKLAYEMKGQNQKKNWDFLVNITLHFYSINKKYIWTHL